MRMMRSSASLLAISGSNIFSASCCTPTCDVLSFGVLPMTGCQLGRRKSGEMLTLPVIDPLLKTGPEFVFQPLKCKNVSRPPSVLWQLFVDGFLGEKSNVH
jgi:hypothetical protein